MCCADFDGWHNDPRQPSSFGFSVDNFYAIFVFLPDDARLTFSLYRDEDEPVYRQSLENVLRADIVCEGPEASCPLFAHVCDNRETLDWDAANIGVGSVSLPAPELVGGLALDDDDVIDFFATSDENDPSSSFNNILREHDTSKLHVLVSGRSSDDRSIFSEHSSFSMFDGFAVANYVQVFIDHMARPLCLLYRNWQHVGQNVDGAMQTVDATMMCLLRGDTSYWFTNVQFCFQVLP